MSENELTKAEKRLIVAFIDGLRRNHFFIEYGKFKVSDWDATHYDHLSHSELSIMKSIREKLMRGAKQ